jgi:hypothetical protein
MKGSKLLFFASWIILVVAMAIVTLLSLQSLRIAYTSERDSLIQGFTLEQVRAMGDQIRPGGGEEAVDAIHGRRATAATWALAYGLLALIVVIGPYRRGERWAWWALLISLGLSQLLSMARILMIGSSVGAGAAGIILAFALIGLLAGAPQLFAKPVAAIDEDLQ